MTLNNLYLIYKFFNMHKDDKMSIRMSYKVNKLLKQIEDDAEFFSTKYAAILQDSVIFNEDGTIKTDDNGNFFIKEDKVDDCNKQINDLMNAEVPSPTITFGLEDFDIFEMSPNELLPFMEIITE